MNIQIKELSKDHAYIIEFKSNSFFDDSIKEGDKYVYYRIGDISEKFPDKAKKYSRVIRDAKDLTTEELMTILSSLVSEIQHKERIITRINQLII